MKLRLVLEALVLAYESNSFALHKLAVVCFSPLGLLPVQNYRPYPQYSAINGNYFDAYSKYDSRQLSFQTRFARGLSFNSNYVWSKFLSSYDSSGWGSRNGINTDSELVRPEQHVLT